MHGVPLPFLVRNAICYPVNVWFTPIRASIFLFQICYEDQLAWILAYRFLCKKDIFWMCGYHCVCILSKCIVFIWDNKNHCPQYDMLAISVRPNGGFLCNVAKTTHLTQLSLMWSVVLFYFLCFIGPIGSTKCIKMCIQWWLLERRYHQSVSSIYTQLAHNTHKKYLLDIRSSYGQVSN